MKLALARWSGAAIYLLSGILGALAFSYPFWSSARADDPFQARAAQTPFLLVLLVGLCLAALLVEVQGQAVSAKVVGVLGVLVAVTSALRFAEVSLPGPGGFSPIFAPIILAGYVFGARFGFMMGAFTLLVSALVTGGVGPWLPYQMFAAGWAGLSAGWLGRMPLGRGEVVILALFGLVWGMLYGVIMNLFFWPYIGGPIDQSWQVGTEIGEAVRRYGVFYLATSLWWDLLRGAGNLALVAVLGRPTLRALRRFRDRFQFAVSGERA